jgi:solute carrier family 35, member E3
MADRSGDRTASVASSVTEAEENEKGSPTLSSHDSSYVKLKTPEEMEISNDVERQELLPPAVPPKDQPGDKTSARAAIIWMVVNTLATIGIVCHIPKVT